MARLTIATVLSLNRVKTMSFDFPKPRSVFLIWSLSLFCCTILVLFAYNMYPVPDGDSIAFIPTIKSYSETGILQNKLFIRPHTIDPGGLGRFLANTPGMTVYVGSFMKLLGQTSYQSAFVSLSLIRCASLLIFSKLIILTLQQRTQTVCLKHLAIPAILIISNAFFLFASNGRSEIISIFFVSIALLAVLSVKPQIKRHIFVQICIGLLFPVNVASAIISMCIYSVYLIFDIKFTRLRLACLFLSIFFSALFLMLSYAVAGVSLSDGINGVTHAAKTALFNYKVDLTLAQSISYYKSWMTFAILGVLQFMRLSLTFWNQDKTSIADRLLLIITVFVLIILAYYFGGRYATNHYTLYAFLTLYQLLAFQLFIHCLESTRGSTHILSFSIIILAAILSLLQPVRASLLFPYYLTSGSTYDQMKKEFEKIDTQGCSVVYTTAVAWLDDQQSGSEYLPSELGGVDQTERMRLENENNSCVVAFVQEVNSNSSSPIGMKLIADLSDQSPYTTLLRSLRLLNSPKGYSFKAYKGAWPAHMK